MMAFEVTDELVEKARNAYHEERSSGLPRQGSSSLMRAAIKAIAPMFRNQVLEEAANIIENAGWHKSSEHPAVWDAMSDQIAFSARRIRAAKTTA